MHIKTIMFATVAKSTITKKAKELAIHGEALENFHENLKRLRFNIEVNTKTGECIVRKQ